MGIHCDSGLVRRSGSIMRNNAPLGDSERALSRHRCPESMPFVRDRGWNDGLRGHGELYWVLLSLHRPGFLRQHWRMGRWPERCLERLGDAKAGECQPPVHSRRFESAYRSAETTALGIASSTTSEATGKCCPSGRTHRRPEGSAWHKSLVWFDDSREFAFRCRADAAEREKRCLGVPQQHVHCFQCFFCIVSRCELLRSSFVWSE